MLNARQDLAHYEPSPAQTDPRNVMLELFEQQLRALLACDCDYQLRAIVARVLPDSVTVPPAPAPSMSKELMADLMAAPRPNPPSSVMPVPAAPLDELQLVNIRAALGRPPDSPQVTSARAVLTAQLNAAKARRAQ